MSRTAPLVTIIGGSGFVGRHIAQAMARRGWRVRVAVRRPNEAMYVKPYGVPGQVEPVQCNIRDEASTRAVIRGADAVVNCVGVLYNSGRNTFDACQAEGAARVARLAAEEGAKALVHLSSLGADASSESAYARSKAEGEAAVTAAYKHAVILRPSAIFGADDGFFNRFAAMARLIPFVLPIVGGSTRFQPVWVEDVAEAAARAACGEAKPGVYELGGPSVMTLSQVVELTLKVTRRKRLVIDIPFFIARIQASFLQLLPKPPLTVDQVALLRHDNVVSDGAKGFREIGIQPTAPEGVIEGYLYAYRPQGQYTQLSERDAA